MTRERHDADDRIRLEANVFPAVAWTSSDILSNVVKCLNQADVFLAPFLNSVPATIFRICFKPMLMVACG